MACPGKHRRTRAHLNDFGRCTGHRHRLPLARISFPVADRVPNHRRSRTVSEPRSNRRCDLGQDQPRVFEALQRRGPRLGKASGWSVAPAATLQPVIAGVSTRASCRSTCASGPGGISVVHAPRANSTSRIFRLRAHECHASSARDQRDLARCRARLSTSAGPLSPDHRSLERHMKGTHEVACTEPLVPRK